MQGNKTVIAPALPHQITKKPPIQQFQFRDVLALPVSNQTRDFWYKTHSGVIPCLAVSRI